MAPRMSLSLASLAQACGYKDPKIARKSKLALRDESGLQVSFQVLLVPGFSPTFAQLPSLLHAGARKN